MIHRQMIFLNLIGLRGGDADGDVRQLREPAATLPDQCEHPHPLRARDERDAPRAIAPLKKAKDAVELDTTALTLDESAEALRKIVEGRCG